MYEYFSDFYGAHEVSCYDAEGYEIGDHYNWGEETIFVDSDDVADFDWCDAD